MKRLSALKGLIHTNHILVKFLLALLLLTATGVCSHLSLNETVKANDLKDHTADVLISLSDFERHYRNVEFLRAVLLLGRGGPKAQPRLDAETQSMEEEYQRLIQLTTDNESQQERLGRLGEMLPEDRTPGRFEARTDRVRGIAQEMDDEEKRLLGLRSARLASLYRLTRWFLIVGKATSFFLLTWCFYQQATEIKRRKAAEGVLIQANSAMDEQIRRLNG